MGGNRLPSYPPFSVAQCDAVLSMIRGSKEETALIVDPDALTAAKRLSGPFGSMTACPQIRLDGRRNGGFKRQHIPERETARLMIGLLRVELRVKQLRHEMRVPNGLVLPIQNSAALYPVRRIYCIGRNYVAHVREMGGDEKQDFPIIFQKPTDSIVQDGAVLSYPVMTDDYHYELELVVAMKSGGYDIPVARALDHVFGYGIGLDMTRRRVIGQSERPNQPWELGKAFDQSCPVGPIHPVQSVGHVDSGAVRLSVDGKIRQDADLNMMIWKTPEIIANLSRYFSLEAGDIILTGTPSGVGAVLPGNELVGTIDGLGSLTVTIAGKVP